MNIKISNRMLASACAAVFVVAIFGGGSARAGVSDHARYQRFANGLQAIVLENHKAPVATLNIFYKVGSRNEAFSETGISHLCEHLMFKGTKKLKPEEFSNIIQEHGGEDNAFTTADFTDYFEIINRDNFDVPIALEADRMENFAPQQFTTEKAVVMEERRLRTADNPQSALEEMTQAVAYVAHPYHWPVIGWMHNIELLTLQDALNYHNLYYSPRNAIVVAVGDFDGGKVMKQLEESFGGFAPGPQPPPVTEVEPPQEGERRVIVRHEANLPAFAIAYHVPNVRNPDDAFPLEIASVIAAQGQSSRLYRDLVMDKRMVVSVDVDYDMTSFDPGLLWISGQMRPGVKTEDAIAEVERQIKLMQTQPISADELQKAKNLEESGFVFGQDSIFEEAMELGLYQMLGDYKMVDQYIPRIEKVTGADVQRVARKYLVDTNRTIGILVPTGLLPHEAGNAAIGQVHYAPPIGPDAGMASGVAATEAIR
ncbi:MAG TPA: pitrilysin family protein [Candidatus Binataceae bacterium]|nr:pitrilysin family protein [Candidatus Binataceae bacterium]